MQKKIGSKFIREICIAGPCIDVTMKYSMRGSTQKRQARKNPSSDAVKKNNDRIARKRLTRLMNANFYPGDLHATFTYGGDAPTPEEARKEMEKFRRRLSREYSKQGKEFKWIEVTEYKNARIHHHMVLSYIEPEIITKQWKAGHVRFVSLDRSRNYRKLAEYFLKETTKTMREPEARTKQRWSASRNLTRPVIKREIIDAREMHQTPRTFKGYEIDRDTINRFNHPFTGIEHLEYMMTSTDPVPRIKQWRKGAVVKRDETIKRAEEIQITLDALEGWGFI